MAEYAALARRIRAPLAADAGLTELVRYATLAANAHNTQAWRFHTGDGRVEIRPDLSRRTPVVDPDDHHLFVSLGCAAENLALAAEATGRRAEIAFAGTPPGAAAVVATLSPGPTRESDLFHAIPQRQCSRCEYDGRAVPTGDLRRLVEAAEEDGVSLLLVTDDARREEVLSCIIDGNTRQMTDPAFVQELKTWVRFNAREAAATGDGLYSAAIGAPSLPPWLGRLAFPWALRPGPENDRCARQVRSAAGLAVFVGERADPDHWMRVGRSYQRFALQATALGIRTAFVNQPVEVAGVRESLAALLQTGGRRPDLVVRFGYGSAMPMSLRRPVAQVIG